VSKQETPPHVNVIAATLGLPVPKFSNAFLAAVGVRPSTYLKNRNIADAIVLIQTPQLDYETIARRAGCGSRTTLFRSIPRITGRTPESFRQ
jgi:methylphosphotriester-DNA--protein-cysteine methyltransferase